MFTAAIVLALCFGGAVGFAIGRLPGAKADERSAQVARVRAAREDVERDGIDEDVGLAATHLAESVRGARTDEGAANISRAVVTRLVRDARDGAVDAIRAAFVESSGLPEALADDLMTSAIRSVHAGRRDAA